MHSSRELTSRMFRILEHGRMLPSFAALCPGFNAHDRLGVVVRHPLEAVQNSALILAAVTAFYDLQRAAGGEFFIYPDYYVFHVDCPPGDYAMFDIWPDHKLVAVPDEPEQILRAINDRAITLLVLNTDTPGEPEFELQTRSAALARLRHAMVRTVAPADIAITGNEVVEKYVRHVVENTTEVTSAERATALERGAQITEHYARMAPAAALSWL